MVWEGAFICLLLFGIILTLIHFKNYFKAVYLAFKLPGPPALPFLGHVHLIYNNRTLEDLGTKMSELYGPIMKCWVSILPFFFITEPEDLQVILSANKCSTKNIFYTFLHNFIGEGLITNTGEKWKNHRRLIQPHFHINVLKVVYFTAFRKYSTIMVKKLKNETDVNITKFANKFVLDVLHDTVLGISPDNSVETTPFRKGKVFILYRVARPWLLVDTIFRITNISQSESKQQEVLQDYTKAILEDKRKKAMYKKVTNANNLMERMLEISENNPEFTNEDIVNEISTFMLAGQDSVGAALAFSLYFLAVHQDVQNNVLEELNSIFGNTDRLETFEDVIKMKYLEQCIKETMRLCPSVPMFCRKLTEDVPIGKYVFPAGTNLFISPFVTHRLPHIFPDPLKFDPERFSPENISKVHPFAYIPFSAGPRNCIGYKFALIEMKTIISRILRNYQLSLTPGHENLNLLYRVTLRAKNGIWLRLKERNEILRKADNSVTAKT